MKAKVQTIDEAMLQKSKTKLTKAELVEWVNNRIRNRAISEIKYQGSEGEEKTLYTVSKCIYDGFVKDWAYNENILMACRAAKVDVAYVTSLITDLFDADGKPIIAKTKGTSANGGVTQAGYPQPEQKMAYSMRSVGEAFEDLKKCENGMKKNYYKRRRIMKAKVQTIDEAMLQKSKTKLTKAELVEWVNNRIRNRAISEIKYQGSEGEEKTLYTVSKCIYDGFVEDWAYTENILMACRAAKVDVAYVTSLITDLFDADGKPIIAKTKGTSANGGVTQAGYHQPEQKMAYSMRSVGEAFEDLKKCENGMKKKMKKKIKKAEK